MHYLLWHLPFLFHIFQSFLCNVYSYLPILYIWLLPLQFLSEATRQNKIKTCTWIGKNENKVILRLYYMKPVLKKFFNRLLISHQYRQLSKYIFYGLTMWRSVTYSNTYFPHLIRKVLKGSQSKNDLEQWNMLIHIFTLQFNTLSTLFKYLLKIYLVTGILLSCSYHLRIIQKVPPFQTPFKLWKQEIEMKQDLVRNVDGLCIQSLNSSKFTFARSEASFDISFKAFFNQHHI